MLNDHPTYDFSIYSWGGHISSELFARHCYCLRFEFLT